MYPQNIGSNKFKSRSLGFTIIELMVSMAMIAVLFALASITLTRLPSSTAQAVNIDTLLTDIRSEQTRAMTGYASQNFGISFTTTSYMLFSDSFVVELDPNLEFIDNYFPGGVVNFASGSGDLLDYLLGEDSISIRNIVTNEVKTIRLNQYGATY